MKVVETGTAKLGKDAEDGAGHGIAEETPPAVAGRPKIAGDGAGPLSGVRVLELGSLIAGPFAGKFFSDFGADVVKVVTAVANGDLKQNLTVKSKGEVAALAETINNMTDTLATFADQVTNVAREVGSEGKLGGQARLWRAVRARQAMGKVAGVESP